MSIATEGRNTARTAQISPDRFGVGIATIALVVTIMLASYWFSFAAIMGAASWTGNPKDTFWLAAIFIDGPILTYTVSFAIQKWRGFAAKRTLFFLSFFTSVSVAVNFAHTAAYWQWDFSSPTAWTGLLIAVSAPIGALLASAEVVLLAFARRKSDTFNKTTPAVSSDRPNDSAPNGLELLGLTPALSETPHPGADDDDDI